jgi:hypothetical protein
MSIEFAKLNGAEIFASGSWNGLKFSDDDLDGIVNAFNTLALSGKVPLKLGHRGPDVRDDPMTQFAMGWVNKIWREGRKLLADLDVPDMVETFVKQGFLKNVSVELLKNVKASNREIPWVLDAVALLGTEMPAVGILKDLQSHTMSRREAQLPHSECVSFARADYQPYQKEGKANMAKENDGDGPTNSELMDKLLAMGNRLTDLETENRTLKSEKAQFSQVRQQLEDVKSENARRDRTERRAALAAVFERAISDEEIVPAAREKFNRIYKVEDDETVMEVTVQDAKEFVRDNPNPLPRRNVKKKVSFSLDTADGDVPPGTLPDQETTMRVKALLASRNIHAPTWEQLAAATKEIFTKMPELGRRYQLMPDALARESRLN